MAEQYLIYDETLSSIASAIRYKLDETNKYLPQEMYDAIMRISGESGIVDDLMTRMVEKDEYPTYTTVSVIDAQGSVYKIREYAFNSTFTNFASFPVCTEIGSHAFEQADWAWTSMESLYLSSVSFPMCQSIYTYAFSGCYGLLGAAFPSAVYMESHAFADCMSASFASFPLLESIPSYAFSYFGASTNREAINYPSDSTIAITPVPADFPACISVGASAFGNAGITSANFPVCESISSCAFSLCECLSSASFPKCKYIGASAFYGDQRLETVNIPVCTSVMSRAFASCDILTSVSAPELQYIGSSAFAFCGLLPSVSFPACTSILSTAFTACSSLSVARFGGDLTIGSSAFRSCTELFSLYLTGSSVASLVERVASTFRGCPIYDQSSIAHIYVPSSLVSAYKSAQYWSEISGEFVSM